MNKHPGIFIMLFFGIFFLFPSNYSAKEIDERKDMFKFLQSAFEAQVSLSEKERSMEEVNKVLSPYFSKEYSELFLEENLHSFNGQFITFGTDFAFFYIPYFSYTDDTKIVREDNLVYVFEFFPANNEGPVSYSDHYDGLLLEETSEGVLVTKKLYNDVPEDILSEVNNEKLTDQKREDYQSLLDQTFLQLEYFFRPLQALLKFGSTVALNEQWADHFVR
ncbi:DUF3993 domain-containing protein [Cytobacillus spongiae]|jgi:succinate dehydrogenase flavin-adding protein (antitoxin of CptAB toxin-antitoxin module)|uniref:DUF3993 domain-containing protein n=1 Tax=Cytobacillus spongiae TaxID=2901381 RepID=UPI001F203B4F|nr:DUF3993 domain-containing protein [Cytobacillus spongiae]UII57225.1 DUF3993 domain-containing protein [Cytobacillus spongiae]